MEGNEGLPDSSSGNSQQTDSSSQGLQKKIVDLQVQIKDKESMKRMLQWAIDEAKSRLSRVEGDDKSASEKAEKELCTAKENFKENISGGYYEGLDFLKTELRVLEEEAKSKAQQQAPVPTPGASTNSNGSSTLRPDVSVTRGPGGALFASSSALAAHRLAQARLTLPTSQPSAAGLTANRSASVSPQGRGVRTPSSGTVRRLGPNIYAVSAGKSVSRTANLQSDNKTTLQTSFAATEKSGSQNELSSQLSNIRISVTAPGAPHGSADNLSSVSGANSLQTPSGSLLGRRKSFASGDKPNSPNKITRDDPTRWTTGRIGRKRCTKEGGIEPSGL